LLEIVEPKLRKVLADKLVGSNIGGRFLQERDKVTSFSDGGGVV